MIKFTQYLIIALLYLLSISVHAEKINFSAMSIDSIKEQATTIHPAGLYILASKLFKDNKKDEALFWFYVGQLRFRFHLVAEADPDQTNDYALFSSLSNVIGTPLNKYAGGDPDYWEYVLVNAKKWDSQNPNSFTSKSKYRYEYSQIHIGMDEIIKYVANNKDKIRRLRRQSGLENRNSKLSRLK